MQILPGDKALVTGGGSGLGKSLCLQLASRGVAVAVADLDVSRANGTVEAIARRQGPHDCFAVACDVGRTDGFALVLEEVRNRWRGELDLLINNAGIASAGELIGTDESEWRRLLDVNLLGVVRGCRTFLPLLLKRGRGHVVNIASFAGLACAPGMVTYNVSKAGVIALSESLRGEVLDDGVGVSVACPAFFKTNLLESFNGSQSLTSQVEKLMQKSSVQADDVAQDILSAVENEQFMIISHRDARRAFRLKRWLPERFFRQLIAQARRWRGMAK